jgi:hypothetical protein
MDTIKMAVWLSRIVRWGLGIYFMVWAYQHEDAKILYLIGGILFITGFLKPRGCIAGACFTDVASTKNNSTITYEEVR